MSKNRLFYNQQSGVAPDYFTLTDEQFLAKKDTILNILNAVADHHSWWEGICAGWARKRNLLEWVQTEVFDIKSEVKCELD